MARLEEFDDVQLDVEFTQAGTRSNLTSKENIAISFGKIAKWYEALVPTGGSSGQFLGFNSSGTAKWVSNPNVDEKVKAIKLAQSTADASYYPTLVAGEGTAGVSIIDSAKINHTKGTTSAVGNTRLILGNATNEGTANNEEGLLRIYSSGTKYHTLKGAKITTDNVDHTLPTIGGTILNTGTTSFTQTLTSGTKIGTIKINGTSSDIYAPTDTDTKVTDTVGTANTYYPAGGTSTSTATGTQVFDTSLKFIGTTGSTSAVGKAQLVLGNSTASGTANNKQGSIVVYGSTAYAHTIQGAPTAARTLTLPDKTGTFALTSDIPSVPTVNNAALTLKGSGTTVTTFTANASSAKSLDIVAGSNVTVTADATNAKISIASSHPTITKSTDTTSTVSPGHGGTFTVVDSITRETNGHVTKINTKTVTLPADTNTDTKVTQSVSTTSNYRPVMLGYTNTTTVEDLATTVTNQVYATTNLFLKPSSGYLYATAFSTAGYLTGAGAQLVTEGLYLKAYKVQADNSVLNYGRYVVKTYAGKAAVNPSSTAPNGAGMLVTIESGGLMIVGSGESAKNLADLISDDQSDTNTDRTRLDVGGTLNTEFSGDTENLILSSDNSIYFLTNCNTIADRTPVVLNTSSSFYPGTTGTGSIGTSSYRWNAAYINTIYENGTSLANKYAGISHTHTTTIAADSGTNQLTLSANTKYKLTAGDTTFIFTTPTDNDTKVTSSANHYTPSTISGQDKSASASGATAAWSIDVVKGVTLNTDGKGHVTGISVTSGKIPANPNTDTKVNVTLATTSKAYLLATTTTPTSTAAAVTSVADTGVYLGTAAGSLYVTSLYENGTSLASKYAAKSHTHSQYYDSTTSRTANTVLAAPNGSNGAATFRKLVAADIPSLDYSKVTSSTTNGNIKIDGTETTVYTHPSHTSKTSGLYKITVDTLGHVSATASVAKGDIPALDYVPNTTVGMNEAINLLTTGSSVPNLDDYYVSQFASGGTTTTTYHRRPISKLWSAFKGLITLETTGSGNAVTAVSIANDGDNNRKITVTKDSTFALSTHTHNYAGSSSEGGPATSADALTVSRTSGDANAFQGKNLATFDEWNGTSTNNTPTAHYYHILRSQGNDSKYGTQLALGMNTNGIYYRNYNNGTWLDWQAIGHFTSTPTSGRVVVTDGTKGGIESSAYTIAKSVPSNAVFTDANVLQSNTAASNYRPILLGVSHSTTPEDLSATVTGQTFVTTKIYAKPADGILYANTFTGDLNGNASSATQVYGTLTNPTASTTYSIPFHTNASSENKSLLNNNGLSYTTLEGTASSVGYGILCLGNKTNSGTAGNKYGIVRIYPKTGDKYGQLKVADTMTGDRTYTFPDKTGTVAMTSDTQFLKTGISYDDSSTLTTNPWHKFAEITISVANTDETVTFMVSKTWGSTTSCAGILSAHLRTGSTKVHDASNTDFQWNVVNEGIDPSNFVMVIIDTANTSSKVELWCKYEARYDGWIFSVIKDHSRKARTTSWSVFSTSTAGSATYTTGTTNPIVSYLPTMKASTFIGNITTLAFMNRIYGLSQTASGSAWNGAETLITSIPSASGTSTPNYQRVKTIDFIKDCISNLKEPVLYENTSNPQTSTTINLPNGIPKYLKVFIGVEYSSDGVYNDTAACINCIDVDMAHSRHGGFIGYDTPGQSGVGNYLAYCYVSVSQNTGSTTGYTISISYANFLNLSTSTTIQNVIARIVKIIAVY